MLTGAEVGFGQQSVMVFFLSFCLLSILHPIVGSPVPSLSANFNAENVDTSFLPNSKAELDSEQIQRYVLGQQWTGHTMANGSVNLDDLSGTGSFLSQEEVAAAWRAQIRKSSGGLEDDPGMRGTNANTNATTLLHLSQSINSSVSLRAGDENENCTLEPASYSCLMDLVQFQRDKDLRLNAIKNYVMQKLGIASKISARPTLERPNFLDQINPSSIFSGQLQTLYASCDIPPHVNRDIWNTPEFFHIYFNIPPSVFTQPQPIPIVPVASDESNEQNFQAMMRTSAQLTRNGQKNHNFLTSDPMVAGNSIKRRVPHERRSRGNSNIISAKLKLYKIGEDNEPVGLDPTSVSEHFNETSVEPTIISNPLFPAHQIADEKIRVSVYWYIKDTMNPVKKYSFKRKLLDTKMLSVKESKWIEFDIQRAAIAWQRQENFGLVVQVENEDNDWVDAKKYFTGLHCADLETETMENSTLEGRNGTNMSTAEVLSVMSRPVLEICTLSLPTTQSNIFVETTEQQKSNHSRSSHHHHRHRHGENRYSRANHRHVNGTQDGVTGDDMTNSTLTNQIKKEQPQGSVVDNDEDQFRLDEGHPLRDILATVASQTSSESHRQRAVSVSSNNVNVDQDLNDSDYDDVIIQKIYISPPSPTHKRHESTNRRTNSDR